MRACFSILLLVGGYGVSPPEGEHESLMKFLGRGLTAGPSGTQRAQPGVYMLAGSLILILFSFFSPLLNMLCLP